MILTESAIVYRGGGRRWFTKKAAINAEAKAMWRSVSILKNRCDCDSHGTPIDYGFDFGEYVCEYHEQDSKVFKRYVRFAKHCIKKAGGAS